MKMSQAEQALLDLLCANHERGVVFWGNCQLPRDARTAVAKFRMRGLLDFTRYLPSPSALYDWRARCALSTSLPGGRTTGEADAPDPLATFAPVPSDEADAPSSGGAFVTSKTPRRASTWPAERKDRFVAALEASGSKRRAMVAVGLKPTSYQALVDVTNVDAEFDVRIRAALTRLQVQEVQASGAKEVAASHAKPAQGVRPDSPSCPDDDGAYGGEALASEIIEKRAVPQDAVSAPVASPIAAAADGRSGGTQLAAWPPEFQEKLDRIAAGAKISEKVTIRKPDPTGTLGGVASGML